MKKKILGILMFSLLFMLPGTMAAAASVTYDGKVVGNADIDQGSIAGVYFLPKENALPLPNSGGLPVMTGSGRPVEYHTGETAGYLIYMPKNSFKPYVSEIKIAKGANKKAAVESLIEQGCAYYVDENYGSGGEFILIGYSRTDDESEAVTDIIGLGEEEKAPVGYEPVSEDKVGGHILYSTKEESMGNPICDIDAFEDVEDTEISSKILTDIRVSRGDEMAKQFIEAEEDYQAAAESEETYLIVGVDTSDGKDSGIALITEREGFAEKRKEKREMLSLSDKKEGVSDEEKDLEKTDETTVDEKKPEDETTDGMTDKISETKEDTSVESAKEGSNFDEKPSEEAVAAAEEAQDKSNTDVIGDAEADKDAQQNAGTVLNVLGGTGATIFFVVLLSLAVVIPVGGLIIRKCMIKKQKQEGEG